MTKQRLISIFLLVFLLLIPVYNVGADSASTGFSFTLEDDTPDSSDYAALLADIEPTDSSPIPKTGDSFAAHCAWTSATLMLSSAVIYISRKQK